MTTSARGAQALTRADVGGEFADGYFYEPTMLKGHNKMRAFQASAGSCVGIS